MSEDRSKAIIEQFAENSGAGISPVLAVGE